MYHDTTLSIDEIFPDKGKNIDDIQSETHNLNKYIHEVKKGERPFDGNIITLEHSSGSIDIFVSVVGDISILEIKTIDNYNDYLDPTNITSAEFSPNSWSNTSRQRTTGTAYNFFGAELFTLWAEGQFRYNGSDVEATFSDGNWERHFLGSTMVIESRTLGDSRRYVEEGYAYAEAYSRLYYEGTFGVRWAGIVMSSGTVEVVVGSTFAGNMYGHASRVD